MTGYNKETKVFKITLIWGHAALSPPAIYPFICSGVGFIMAFKPIDSIGDKDGTMVTSPWYFCFTMEFILTPKNSGNTPSLCVDVIKSVNKQERDDIKGD